MEHCVYSDFLRQYTASQIDESQLAAVLAVTDTPERQRHFREALPSVVQAALTDEETRNQARQVSWTFSLPELIILLAHPPQPSLVPLVVGARQSR